MVSPLQHRGRCLEVGEGARLASFRIVSWRERVVRTFTYLSVKVEALQRELSDDDLTSGDRRRYCIVVYCPINRETWYT